MMDYRKRVDKILDPHSLKAQKSSCDRDTNVMAVLTARERLMRMSGDVCGEEYLQDVLRTLDEFSTSYNDPDGEFTCGRSMVVGLRDDVRLLLRQGAD